MVHGSSMPGLLQLPYQSNCSGRSAAASRADAARTTRTWYTYHEIFMAWLPVAGTAAWRVRGVWRTHERSSARARA